MPGRSAAQLSRKPGEWKDHQQAERRQHLEALRTLLEQARGRGEPWYRWIEWRQRGEHHHDLRDEQSRRVACPVAGCDAVRGAENPHQLDGGRSRRSGHPAATS